MKRLLTIIFGTVLLFTAIVGNASAGSVPECVYNRGQDAWKIINAGGGLGDLLFDTEAECLAFLAQVPTATGVPTFTDEPTVTITPIDPTITVTSTSVPTETQTPTETLVPTETSAPTETQVVEEETSTPVATQTVVPESTLVVNTPVVTVTPAVVHARVNNVICRIAYEIFKSKKYKDVGYQIVANHPWCEAYMLNKFGFVIPER